MPDKKPLAERIVAALREHGNLTLEKIAKHADTTVATLYTMMGTLKKLHGVTQGRDGRPLRGLRLGQGDAGKPRARDALASGGELGRKTPYAATLAGLAARRTDLLAEVAKVDRAIEAVKAIA
jgi:DNA-binding IclR family transcriptional regulator